MLKAVFENGTVNVVPQSRPVPAPGEALVRVVMAGICNTDVELHKGYYGFSGTPGHEFTGVVEAAPDAPELIGRRVTADINIAPNPDSRRGASGPGADIAQSRAPALLPARQAGHRHAPGRTVLGILGKDGAFASFLTIPLENLRFIPDGLPDEKAVFAEPLAAALEVAQQVLVKATDRVLVLGDGKLGILAALGLRLWNPGIVLAGRHPEKLAIAAAQGVTTALSRDVTGPFDLIIEATGRAEGIGQALDRVRPEGTIVLKTTVAGNASINLSRVVVDEITLLGSRCGDIDLALDHLARGLVDPSGLVEAVYPMERFPEAFERAMKPGARKVLLRMDG
jgi:threonine dehydrogenase-like Zn-dependent dehydrogenase